LCRIFWNGQDFVIVTKSNKTRWSYKFYAESHSAKEEWILHIRRLLVKLPSYRETILIDRVSTSARVNTQRRVSSAIGNNLLTDSGRRAIADGSQSIPVASKSYIPWSVVSKGRGKSRRLGHDLQVKHNSIYKQSNNTLTWQKSLCKTKKSIEKVNTRRNGKMLRSKWL